jgi:cysteine-rich repeat protein
MALDYDTNDIPELGGLTLNLGYDPVLVNLPGSGSEPIDRYTDLSTGGGFFDVNDHDTGADGNDDRIDVGYLGTANIEPGDFGRLVFDCVAGAAIPTAEDFACDVPTASDPFGFPVEGVACVVTVEAEVAATPTPEDTATPTQTRTTTSTPVVTPTLTPTETPSMAICGNDMIEEGETCDDGNTETNDACPPDCVINICTPGDTMTAVDLRLSVPGGSNVASTTLLLEYPDGTVQIPGTGADASVGARITNRPSGRIVDGVDLDYALRIGVAGTQALTTTGPLLRIAFDNCRDVTLPQAADFACIVLTAFGTDFQPVAGVTCSVTVP